jgi:hypothetical protein
VAHSGVYMVARAPSVSRAGCGPPSHGGTPSPRRSKVASTASYEAMFHIPTLPSATPVLSSRSREVYAHEIALRSGSQCAVAASLPSPPPLELPQLSHASCATPIAFRATLSGQRASTTPAGFRRMTGSK